MSARARTAARTAPGRPGAGWSTDNADPRVRWPQAEDMPPTLLNLGQHGVARIVLEAQSLEQQVPMNAFRIWLGGDVAR